MVELTWRFEGKRAVVSSILTMNEKLQRELRLIVGKHGRNLRDLAKRRAPVGVTTYRLDKKPVPPGTLRDAIVARRRGLVSRIGVSRTHLAAHYARFVEFGTKKMPARPYLHPAARVVAPQFRSEVESKLSALIRRTQNRVN